MTNDKKTNNINNSLHNSDIKTKNLQSKINKLQNEDNKTIPNEGIKNNFSVTERTKEYYKKELLGYSMKEMYEVVADVTNYHKFVPYVKKSTVHSEHNNGFKADLIVGFPPLNEVYTSNVKLEPPRQVKAVGNGGRLFKYLLNEWHFSPGLKDIPQSCVVDFRVKFKCKSYLHNNIANIFFDMIANKMEEAFIMEARRRFGSPSIEPHTISSSKKEV